MVRVALATCQVLPEPDADHPLLEDALRAAGIDAHTVAWDNPAIDWSSFDEVVLRSTWNYHHRVDSFVDWIDRVGRATRLRNPPEVVRANVHKKYLLDLLAAGVRAVPTELIVRGTERGRIAHLLQTHSLQRIGQKNGGSDIVVKPATSAGSFQTRRFSDSAIEEAIAHVEAIHQDRDALVQPFIPSVLQLGERCAVFIDGEFTHVVRKSPRFDSDDEHVVVDAELTEAERALAQRALAPHQKDLLYARVDMVRDKADRPMVAELELIEPSLFLAQAPRALARLVHAIGRHAK